MKITINANVTPTTIDSFLEKSKQKTDAIDKFCKSNGIKEMYYKDSELEYEFVQVEPKAEPKIETKVDEKPKVETRPKVASKETRKGE